MSEGIAAALARAQAKFTTITKGRTATVPTKNGPGYTYSYADLGDVLAAVRPVLAGEGIAVVQATEETEHGTVLVTRLLHGSDSIEGRLLLPVGEHASAQQIGSAFTYARRYALCSMVGVAAEDDDDGQAAQQEPAKARVRRSGTTEQRSGGGGPKASDAQVKLAGRLMEELISPAEQFDTIERVVGRRVAVIDLTVGEASKLIDHLQDVKKNGTPAPEPEWPADEEPF